MKYLAHSTLIETDESISLFISVDSPDIILMKLGGYVVSVNYELSLTEYIILS